MRPLSAFKHYLSNRKKFLFIFIPVLLSVIVIYTLQMLITSQYRIVHRTYVEPQKCYLSIAAKSKVIGPDTIKGILSMKADYERVLPWVSHYTYIDNVIDSSIGTKVFTVKHEDMELLMSKMNLKIREGRLPKAGTNEIVLHYIVAGNKRLGIGDKIGGSVQRNEALEGEKEIVGLLEGESIVSFDSLEYWMKVNQVESDDYSTGMIIVPKDEKTKAIGDFLKNIDVQGLDIRTYDSVALQNKSDLNVVNIILTVISIMVIIIVTICTGFISYININQRRSEFGILSAIGYTSQEIINRIFYEIFWLNVAGLITGVLLSIFVGILLNLFIFIPKGIPLLLIKPEYIIEVACVPLFVCIFALIPVWKMLKSLDPVTIIEGMI